MIIVAQAKKMLINTSAVSAYFTQGTDVKVLLTNGQEITIGRYNTEQIALGVIEDIARDMADVEYVDIYNNMPIARVSTNVFFMPEEDGNGRDTSFIHGD